eukprot:CAMPEP_0202883886 /NCGR_PEP_ID=MMETSP1391-20130828/40127_1 /ASSEMBLY_ACC=CAM_ASM_000867 /TAXON_ID=1034604 /ORGANISM="Chlamydomonas leiostraca, Strain SAG 11-49" /LENGTH=192 /DNA_ID=CAMNT_0049566979 /DNA_START=137 /DNA_END=712 /DNA_ORIENTATION=+
MTMQIDTGDSHASPSKSSAVEASASRGLEPLPLTPPPANGGSYKARRYALKFDPPCIFLEYEDLEGKRRVRAVKISKIVPGMDADRLARKVIRSFPRKLDMASVKYDQVRKLVSRLVQHSQLQVQGSLPADGTPPLVPALSPKLPGDLGRVRSEGLPSVRASTESRFSSSTADIDATDDMDAALMELDREMM